MALFTDNLDGTAGDLLSARSGWSRPAGADAVQLAIGGSGFLMTGGTTAASGTWHAPTSQPSSADQYAEAILTNNNQIAFALGVRCDTSNSLGAGYILRYNGGALVVFRRSAAGALTSIGTYTVPTPADLNTNKVRLSITGTSLIVTFKGGTVIGPVTDTNIASGSVAMLSRGGSMGSTVAVDDWGSSENGVSGIVGTASGTIAFTGSATGTVAVTATASGSIAFAGSSAGIVAVKGLGAGSISFTGASTGVATATAIAGAASGAIAFTGSAQANVAVAGAAVGELPFLGSAIGSVTSPLILGTVAGSISFDGAATGSRLGVRLPTVFRSAARYNSRPPQQMVNRPRAVS